MTVEIQQAQSFPDRNVQSSDLKYQPVVQESEWSVVRTFLNGLSANERPSENILRRVGKGADIKAQLVYLKNAHGRVSPEQREKELLCGVVVYEESMHGSKSIKIHILRTADDHLFSGKGICRHMLYKITSLAKSFQCPSIYASVNGSDHSSLRFFEGNLFHRCACSNPQEVLLMRRFADEVEERKRSVPDATVEAPHAKGARRTPPMEKYMEVTLKQQYLSLINSGRKTIEGRIAAGMFSRVHQGSRIHFFNQQDEARCLVTRVAKYASFAEMLQKEGVEKCLPGTTLEDGKKIYDAIPGYKERAQKNGVFAIELKLEKS